MGCCICCKQIEKKRKKEVQLCIDLNNENNVTNNLNDLNKGSSKHESVMKKLNKVHFNEEKDSDTSTSYQLNDLRSLEGVAKLWANNGKFQSPIQLQPIIWSSSTPVTGNMYNTNNALSPITISTYFFRHTPPNQMNLLRSHSDHIASNTNNNNNNNKKKSNDLLETLTPQLDMISENNYNNFNLNINTYSGTGGGYCNSAPNSGCSTPQKFSSVSASNLKSPYLNMNLSPLVSDNDADNENEMEIEIEIEMDIENPEDDIFTVISDMENKFNLSNEDFIEHGKNNNLGVGASGIVKKAFHFSSCKMLAIKHCRSLKKDKLLAFEKEANLYRKFIDNKYIIEIIGIGKGNKNNELIMGLEFMDLNSCQSLQIHKNIKNICVRENVIGYIAWNILQGLDCLHSNLYVHNDIKPANILVNKYGEIKISDFDTVLQLHSSTHMLNKNNGTQKYQSPEKVIFTPCYNTNSDIWSLGITLYELLFGEKQCDSDHDEVSYTTNPPVLSPEILYENQNLSINCCDFINKCLIVDREYRPHANELLEHIWLENDIKGIKLKDKWPWLHTPETAEYNDDLLFMINSLIGYYSRRKFSTAVSKSASFPQLNGVRNNRIYSDEERIENMAKYAYCTKDTVVDRIRVTVAYIKSQLNKMDVK